MKTYKQFITESQEVLDKISKAYGKKHRGVNVDASYDQNSNRIRVNNLWVPPHLRSKGIGGRIMRGLSNYADKNDMTSTLNQAPEKGKKEKLAKFYKSHGYEPNKGRNKDFTTRDTFIRSPKKK
jgi:predicted GNAT family acetyltransferase